ncbi:MAG: aspartate ammonia-lyase [Alphaproteobacteria bacterium]|nr:aspartate ammonia-lyase [Alphaproteobacteria bacterium]
MRKEKDSLGEMNIDSSSLWGIHTQRAIDNFPLSQRKIPYSLISGFANVKQACAVTNKELGYLPKEAADAISKACEQLASGEEEFKKYFPVDALQGGAGTSTNMNVNEVIANLALSIMGKEKGDYNTVSPLDYVNMHQSTNDTYPAALRIAAVRGIKKLEDALSKLQSAFEDKEKEFAGIIKMGRTELQDAVPMSLGQEFSAFTQIIARSKANIKKCSNELLVLNLGGTAIGSGAAAPREFILKVCDTLKKITKLNVVRSDNLFDATGNADNYVSVSGTLATTAAAVSKIVSDLRLLHFLKEIALPPKQAGSSIMPAKVNPVITECCMQVSMVVRANNVIISECASRAVLQINEFMPLIACSLLESIDILTNACSILALHVSGIKADVARCRQNVDDNPAILAVLMPYLKYDEVLSLIKGFTKEKAANPKATIKNFIKGKSFDSVSSERLAAIVEYALSDESLTSLGHVELK